MDRVLIDGQYIPRRARNYVASMPSMGTLSQYKFVFLSAVLIANSCFNDFMALIQKKIKQQKKELSE